MRRTVREGGRGGSGEDGEPEAGRELSAEEAEIEIPWQRLSEAALRGVIEDFCTREGTEYGEREVPLEAKVVEVRRQLERGEAYVLFDARTETTNVVTARELRERRRPAP